MTAAQDADPRPAVPALRLRSVCKTFPGVRALHSVDLDVQPGTVHALLGHNGCGKSTLVKALAGFHNPDSGCSAWLGDEPLELGSSVEAERLGLRFVHQDLGLVLELGAMDNIGLVRGYLRSRSGRIRWGDQARQTHELLARFGLDLDPCAPLSEASPVERTAVAIVRAVAGWEPGRGLLVLDEPTAALPAREVDELFRLVREIRDTGTAVLLISHRLDEVMTVADHATVMRNGEICWDGAVDGMSVGAFAALIADVEGTADMDLEPRRAALDLADQPVVLTVEGVTGRYLHGVDLELRRGEVLGIAGLLGSGREELPYAVAGAAGPGVHGRFTIGDTTVDRLDIGLARSLGVALVPADRAGEGVVPDFTVGENVTLAALPSLRSILVGARGHLPRQREREFAQSWLSSVSASPDVVARPIGTLSGGNQQKAVLARWLSIAPLVLAISEPTAGIDIGARTSLYEEVRARADDGLAVLVSSSDAEDLVAVCDRVLVLRDGHIATELRGEEITKAAIVHAMEGAHA